MLNKMKAFRADKMLMIKVIAGILLLAVAFCLYLGKNRSANDDISISDFPNEIATINSTAADGVITDEAINNNSTIMIDVSGAVSLPSVVELSEGSRVFEAIDLAGGMTKEADTTYINLARVLSDGEKIYIPTKNELQNTIINDSSLNSKNPPYFSNTQESLININTADSNALQQLTGVGPSTAEKIINYRNENGNFKKIEDLKNVSGIGDKTFEKFKNKITV